MTFLNKKTVVMFLTITIFVSCKQEQKEKTSSSSNNQTALFQQENIQNLIPYVNPMIGTQRMGHVYPGATAPFGMVQLSPDTNFQVHNKDGKYNKRTYEYCSGYQYDDSTIFGFSHTHFSGTGHSDLGDFLMIPTTGELKLEPGDATKPQSGYHSQFSHDNEQAEAGYYSVKLDDYNIKAELTASERVGFHQYTFPKSDNAHIILDLVSNIYHYDNKNVWTFVRVLNDSLVVGYRQTKGWAKNKKVHFAMAFSKPFKSYGHKKYDKETYSGFYGRFNQEDNFPEMDGKNIRAFFNFDTEEGEQIKIKFALSNTGMDGALKNLEAEVPHWDFNKVKKETQEKWNTELNKVQIETLTKEDKISFYTSLYHTMLSPILYEDVDGKYLGLDQNIHQSDDFTNYTIFSLWDTYRALHPWFTIYQPKRNNDMIKSMLAHQEQSVHGMLPIWSHYANENWCMIGYHSVPVIADAIAKDIADFDTEKALQASISTSTVPYFDGLKDYMALGYIPDEYGRGLNNSVSKVLEFAYDDWTIAQMANKLNNKEVEATYLKRSENYKNVYDASIGFMRPKNRKGEWRKKFDPLDTHGQGFIEGNAWTYSLFVPHDPKSLIELMGGEEIFITHLDSIFTMELPDKYIEYNEDITKDGIMGNYVHGNEPGHHIPYLYNWTSEPWKTQERVRIILRDMYGITVDGLCGNDDAGQMSAWYIFTSLGFYPVSPGNDQYAIGSPLVKKATLYLENGKKLTINTENQGAENFYVQKVEINGIKIDRSYLKHSDITNGGEIKFYLSDTPNKTFGLPK